MDRHLRFTYQLMFYQSIESKKKAFLSEYDTINPIRRQYHGNITINEKIIIDKENETLTIFRTKEYLDMFEGRVGGESYNLTFQKYITDQIWEEYNDLISEIDISFWRDKKEDFYNFLEKVKIEVNFITTQINKYLEKYANEDIHSESFEGIISHTDTMLESILKHLEDKYSQKTVKDLETEHTKIDTSKKHWLKLIREAKIEEVLNELFELEKVNENTVIIMISSRWNSLRQDVNKGILDTDKYDLEFNKIIKSLIEFVKSLD